MAAKKNPGTSAGTRGSGLRRPQARQSSPTVGDDRSEQQNEGSAELADMDDEDDSGTGGASGRRASDDGDEDEQT